MKFDRLLLSVLITAAVSGSAFSETTTPSAAQPAAQAGTQPAASQPMVSTSTQSAATKPMVLASAQPAAPATKPMVLASAQPVAPAAKPIVLASAQPVAAPAVKSEPAHPMMLASAQSASQPSAAPMMLAAAQTISPAQQKQIEDVVHNYLVKNPEVLVESLQNLQQKQMEQARKNIQKTQENSPKFVDALFHQTTDPIIGNPNGKVTIVEFFDYQCPHCVDMTPIMESIAQGNNDLRIIFKEFPIRGQVSEIATKAALAAKIQGKYFEFHKAIMAIKEQPITEDAIYKAAQTVPGLNVDKLKADMKSDAVNQQIKANYKLAQDLQLIGTPAFFIAKSTVTKNAPVTAIAFVPGQISKDQLLDIIKKFSQ